jgi:uncharacterized protein YneF (UPF0154 family)
MICDQSTRIYVMPLIASMLCYGIAIGFHLFMKSVQSELKWHSAIANNDWYGRISNNDCIGRC